MSKKYHASIYLPDELVARARVGQILLIPSGHAIEQSRRKGIQLPDCLNTDTAQVVECEIDGRELKFVYRVQYDATCDLCLAVIPKRRFLKTVWLNTRNDNHVTLNTRLYQQANWR